MLDFAIKSPLLFVLLRSTEIRTVCAADGPGGEDRFAATPAASAGITWRSTAFAVADLLLKQ